MLKNDETVEQVKQGRYENAGLDPQDVAMLEFVSKLTRAPADMKQEDVAKLRDLGFSDAEILVMVHVAGHFAFINRLSDALGVELEEEWPPKKARARRAGQEKQTG